MPPTPSTPLGSFEDSAVSWTSWVTLMSFTGLVTLALLVAAPARGLAAGPARVVRIRLTWAAILAGVLAFPAVLSDQARGASQGGYDYAAAWRSLFDGSTRGLLVGLEAVLPVVGALVLVPVALRRAVSAPIVGRLRISALVLSVVALGATRFPSKAPTAWGRSVFRTFLWLLHLIGGGVWVGGLLGLVLLAVRGGLDAGFWSAAIRRFSAVALGCVAAIGLSGLYLYWEHVDGPSQLFTTMYGRVLGVKLLLFGGLLVLGAVNQFWLHPRIDALRASGDDRRLHTILARRFPAVVGAEVALVLALLFVAPFLHGSARNQAYQADRAKAAHAVGAEPAAKLPKLAQKQVSTSTWVEGTAETAAVLCVTVAGYRFSGRLARRRVGRVSRSGAPAA